MVIWNQRMVVDGTQPLDICLDVVVEKLYTCRIHGTSCGKVDGDDKMDEVLESKLVLRRGCRPTPERDKSQDHMDRTQRPPVISFQLPMRR